MIEKKGSCRIFSMVTENFRWVAAVISWYFAQIFRPSTLTIEGEVEAAFSSSDGSCLFMKTATASGYRILCHHWASFGGVIGTIIAWPEQIPVHAQMAVSSVGSRNSTHIIFMVPQHNFCWSLYVRIPRKSSEYVFRSNDDDNGSTVDVKRTVNNSLIDCHSEVWTRFPVYAPICRETTEAAVHAPRSITFVSSAPSTSFAPYFSKMIRDF